MGLSKMASRVRIIKHEPVPRSGSFEVRFSDGRASRFFYWDDLPTRRLRPESTNRQEALKLAQAFARAERTRENHHKRQPSEACRGYAKRGLEQFKS
jgi:hypothetical protein